MTRKARAANPPFGEIRVIVYCGIEITVMSLGEAHNWTSKEGTGIHDGDSGIPLLVLHHEGPRLGIGDRFYPLHDTATCDLDEWNNGRSPA